IIDTTLIKIYADADLKSLNEILKTDNSCNLNQCEAILLERKRYYALSLLYKRHGLSRKVLEIWVRILSNEFEDTDFGGLPELVNLLNQLTDKDLMLEYTNWVLKKDPLVGANIFTQKNSVSFDPDEVLNHLEPFGTATVGIYLEFLVKVKKTMDESKHTRLASVYIDNVLKVCDNDKLSILEGEFVVARHIRRQTFVGFIMDKVHNNANLPENDLTRKRAQLLVFLRESELYKPSAVLAHIEQTQIRLHAERAFLYSKSDEHETVLKILVNELGDYAGAEEYCLYKSSLPSRLAKSTSDTLTRKNLTEVAKAPRVSASMKGTSVISEEELV
ncbi:transforming growth factor, beta receptor associated protein 1, partial [Nowakowskiella sp. JEL0078]